MVKQQRAERVSSEAFTAHIHGKYGKPLPVWAATEVMSFGSLKLLYEGMSQVDRQEIAAAFDVFLPSGDGDAHAFASWLERLRQTRNSCAHHARLWNRNQTALIAVPDCAPEL